MIILHPNPSRDGAQNDMTYMTPNRKKWNISFTVSLWRRLKCGSIPHSQRFLVSAGHCTVFQEWATSFLLATTLARITLSLNFPMRINASPFLFFLLSKKTMQKQIPQNQSIANLNCCETLWNYFDSEAHLLLSLSLCARFCALMSVVLTIFSTTKSAVGIFFKKLTFVINETSCFTQQLYYGFIQLQSQNKQENLHLRQKIF